MLRGGNRQGNTLCQLRRDELKKFIEAVSHMAYSAQLTIGQSVAKDIIERGHFLMKALDHDETIP